MNSSLENIIGIDLPLMTRSISLCGRVISGENKASSCLKTILTDEGFSFLVIRSSTLSKVYDCGIWCLALDILLRISIKLFLAT
ncbi:MAG: hypothetical protein QXZ09_06925, partial [Candidatus Methanomethylicaceae archaeon]